ncbi:MAG TPA: cupin domain-containing protein [Polyangia bacterium]|jgi:ribosomal protein L16 Arg81 hydroxylase|nr:cupin domain-containing protein [Polyangia bacterium]
MLRPGHELEDLIAPIALPLFMERYWNQASLYIPAHGDKLEGVFSSERLRRALTVGAEEGSLVYLKTGQSDAQGQHREVVIRPEQAFPLFKMGLTVQIERVETADAELGALCQALRRQLHVATLLDGGAFLSPPGHGYGLHYDASSMWILQIEGAKRWWYGETPALAFPTENRVPSAAEHAQGIAGYDEKRLREQLLRPGDVLYLPAGTWHRVRAEETSLHVCLTIRPSSPYLLVEPLLQAELLADPAWRHLPTFLATELDGAVSPEARKAAMEDYFAARLGELRQAVDRLTPGLLYRAWSERVAPRAAAVPEAPIGPEEVLAHPAGRPLRQRVEALGEEEEKIILHDGGLARASLPGHARTFVEALLAQPRFTVQSALAWDADYEWEDVEAVLRGLVELGLLERVGPGRA